MGKKSNSRTTNTIFNFMTTIGGQVLTITMQFIVRTVFIKTLGTSYLGISGLFSNILSMLSLAELGVGNAILFKLYEPIAKENHQRIKVLMKFYRTIYTYIGIIVALIGLTLIPFLPYLINDYDKLEKLHINAGFIFILYLLQSVSSYFFFAYKSAIVRASQKEYLLTMVKYITTTVSTITQIVLLIFFRNFILYVIILLMTIIVENIIYAMIANKMYPYLRTRTKDKLEKEEVVGIFKDCGALLLYKLNEFVLKATDNIVLSMFMGLDMVALYSNYYVFYTTMKVILERIFTSVAHSVGNLHTTHNAKHEYQVFEAINFVSALAGGIFFVGLFGVADEFILNWIGEEWIIPAPFAFLMGLEIFTTSLRKVLDKYRNAMGLFQQAKYRPLAGMIINLVFSVILVNYWGICGVLLGTIVADWSTCMWFDSMILHKYGFDNVYSVKRYYFKVIKYLLVTVAVGIADVFICQHFLTGFGWISFVIHGLICVVTTISAFAAVSWRTEEFKYFYRLMNRFTKKIKKKIKK